MNRWTLGLNAIVLRLCCVCICQCRLDIYVFKNKSCGLNVLTKLIERQRSSIELPVYLIRFLVVKTNRRFPLTACLTVYVYWWIVKRGHVIVVVARRRSYVNRLWKQTTLLRGFTCSMQLHYLPLPSDLPSLINRVGNYRDICLWMPSVYMNSSTNMNCIKI